MSGAMFEVVGSGAFILIFLLAGLLWRLGGFRPRRFDRLTYDAVEQNPWVRVNEAMARVTGRTSVSEWRRRCAASTTASRRRRGI